MPRKKPTRSSDVIGNMDLKPEEAVADYFLSRQQDRFFVKPPNWDSPGDSIEMLFISNQREYEQMCVLKSEVFKNAKRQAEINCTRIQKMYKTQDRLRKRFIEVNSFIKDCADKRRSAEKAIQHESELHEELTGGIDECNSSIKELDAFRNDLKRTVKEFEPYERVLDDVVKVSDIFESPKDCMDRCDALMLAQVEINKLEMQKIQEIEEMRKTMLKVTNEAALTVLGLKNDLAKLERSYNNSRTMCLKMEKILGTTKDTVTMNDLDKDRTLDCVQILYRLLCKRRDIDASFSRRDVESSMDFIKREVELLVRVLRKIKAQKSSNKPEKPTTHEGPPC
ncbi:uncharacterized protein LOC115626226 [Scaptodrosophila lebanonensis]|uniref:Uncharacterized protein LOC115626226 n=1 Tax=Drosophila lebanonensis TaxID=7225 RepID=A0A6J2TPF0_DROLE|nr:uncharacterized protein LOC115626226 [Scaptodrosophila lebanonensis]